MNIIRLLFLSCLITVSWADFLADIVRDKGNGSGGSSSTSAANHRKIRAKSAPSCDHIQSLPLEFISLFTEEGKFEAKVEDGKIKFTPLKYRNCFLGNDAPISIEAKIQNGHYVITAMITGKVTDKKGEVQKDSEGNERMIASYERVE